MLETKQNLRDISSTMLFVVFVSWSGLIWNISKFGLALFDNNCVILEKCRKMKKKLTKTAKIDNKYLFLWLDASYVEVEF